MSSPRGFWTLDNINDAKRIVRDINTILGNGKYRPEVEEIVQRARALMNTVSNNKPEGDVELPL